MSTVFLPFFHFFSIFLMDKPLIVMYSLFITTFSPYFHLFFQKVFHILPGLLISFSTKPACCLHLIHAHPQQVSFGTTIYTHFNQAFYKFSLSSVFYKFSLVFFSAMCYIKKNVFTGYTVTILFFQITIQQILFREAFSL